MDKLGAILPLVLLVVAFFFLVVRPARARQRKFLQTQSELAPGTEIMMSSGIYGEIVSLGEETLELQIAPSTVVKINRQAVARVIAPDPAPDIETSIDD